MAGIELSADDRAGMTPAEIEALTGADADANLKAAGDDSTEATGTPAEGAAAAEEGAPSAAAAEGAPATGEAVEGTDADLPNADELAELLEADAPKATDPAPYKVEGPADYKAERTALRAEKSAVEEKWTAGELTDAERAAELAKLDDKIEDLLVAHTRAETLRTANEQTAAANMNAAVNAILTSAKVSGVIDYQTDPKAAKQFDTFLNALLTDPDNSALSMVEVTQQAHRSVLALRGIAEKPAAATVQAAAPAAQAARRDVPRATLADMPNAATPIGIEDDVLTKFGNLEGDDAEDYLSSLPPAMQERVLRAADKGAMSHRTDARSRRGRAEA